MVLCFCQQAQTHTVVVIALFVVMLMFYLHTAKGFLQRAAVIICSCSSAAYISTHAHTQHIYTHMHTFFFFNVWKKVQGCLYIHIWLGASCMQINCSFCSHTPRFLCSFLWSAYYCCFVNSKCLCRLCYTAVSIPTVTAFWELKCTFATLHPFISFYFFLKTIRMFLQGYLCSV